MPVEEERLLSLPLSAAGVIARDCMLRDLRALRERDLAPELNHICGSTRPVEEEVFCTEVHSFHVDSAPVEAETWLCTYHGATSELLPNEGARPRVEIPTIRRQLLELFGGVEGAEFEEFLHENSYDSHYDPLPGAQPISFGRFNLWRIAIRHPGCLAPPCIHRAPQTLPGDTPRLLLIS